MKNRKQDPIFVILGILFVVFVAIQASNTPELAEFSSTETTQAASIVTTTQNTQVKPKIVQNSPKTQQPKPTIAKTEQQPSQPIVSMGSAFNNTLFNLVNNERVKAGFEPLAINAKLVKAAQLKAADMVTNNYFAHTSPAGLTPSYWEMQAGYSSYLEGENLAVLFQTPEATITAWMNSPTHRANILNPDYKEAGLATAVAVYKGQNTFYIVQEFGGKY